MIPDVINAITSLLKIDSILYLIGWLLAAFLLWRNFTSKDSVLKETEALRAKSDEVIAKAKAQAELRIEIIQSTSDAKINNLKDSHIQETRTMYESLQELNNKNAKLFAELSEKRVADIKEIGEEYNKIANAIIITLERLTTSIQKNKE